MSADTKYQYRVSSLQSLGVVDSGFTPECSHCSTDYWIASSAPDAAYCPYCGFSGLAGLECVFEPDVDGRSE